MRKRNPLRKWPYIFVAPFVITYLMFYLYPMVFSFGISLTDWTAVDMDTRNFVMKKTH